MLKRKSNSPKRFNPVSETTITNEQLLQILRGEIKNPNSAKLFGKTGDYSFIVAGVSSESPINSWAGQMWGVNGYPVAHDSSEWYGKISCVGDSEIVIPVNLGRFYLFNARERHLYRVSKFDTPPYAHNDLLVPGEDCTLRTLVLNVSVDELVRDFSKVFQR